MIDYSLVIVAPIDIASVIDLQQTTVALWHRQEIANPYCGFLHVVCEQHQFNYRLWHEEDVARSPDVGDPRIAAVKRAIDGYNQKRNDCIEQLDDYLVDDLRRRDVVAAVDARQNTETPGSAIDRLSIMALRLYHMQEQATRVDAPPDQRAKVNARLTILREQHGDLANSLAELLSDIYAGRKRLKVYRQFKMYNDPTLNPYLYQSPHRRAG